MSPALIQLVLRATACAGLAAVLAWWAGVWALVLVVPLAGVWLARPLLELTGDVVRGVKAQAWRDVEGRHAEFRGRPLDVVEDEAGHRWIATDGLRRIVTGLPADAVLARLVPWGLLVSRRGSPARVEAEALLTVLARATDADTHRFVRWVEREIVRPARRARGEAIGAPLGPAPGSLAGSTPAPDSARGADPVASPPTSGG
jgi:hypothetical protein